MKSLTPWCNLYYSASRFNIKVSPSSSKAVSTFLVILGACYIFGLFTIGFKLWFTLLILLIIFIIIRCRTLILHYFQYNPFSLFSICFLQKSRFFVLTETGKYQLCNRKEQQLSSSSQINLWGYWLVFIDQKRSSEFIFKDSLSEQDQARVARIIMRLKA